MPPLTEKEREQLEIKINTEALRIERLQPDGKTIHERGIVLTGLLGWQEETLEGVSDEEIKTIKKLLQRASKL